MEISAFTLQALTSFRSGSTTSCIAATYSAPLHVHKGHLSSISKSCLSGGDCLVCRNCGPSIKCVARADGRCNDGLEPIAPLQPESPSGLLLNQLLHSHPYLVPAAAEQQLEKLAKDRDALITSKQPSTTAPDVVLYRRIVELKSKERRKAVEEIIYALVVEKFVNAGIRLAPKISSLSSQYRDWNSSTLQDKQLKCVHTPEVLDIIQEHSNLVLAAFSYLNESRSPVSQAHVGILYVTSIMYGYFLRRVDRRFQLERTLRLLPSQLDKDCHKQFEESSESRIEGGWFWNIGERIHSEILGADFANLDASLSHTDKTAQGLHSATSSLLAYIMSCDHETLRRYGMIRFKESMCVMEKHTEALVGKLPDINILPEGSIALISKDQMLEVSFFGLKRLILEAVTFGSFLWDVESYVDVHYNFIA